MEELKKFLVNAKVQTYAGDGAEVKSERKDFNELEFSEGDWYYRDSYTGFFMAPGQELVKFKGKIIWTMSYSGGMKKEFHGDIKFSIEVFGFLKKCLKKVDEEKPYRGPENFKEGDFEYVSKVNGTIEDFSGNEKIMFKGKVVFEQNYIGGLVVSK